jgi:polyisoprenyl-phosphate glycosyltransferase
MLNQVEEIKSSTGKTMKIPDDNKSTIQVSIVSPAFNEEKNLPIMYERLAQIFAGLELEWEWVVVDDHSADGTYATLADLAANDGRVRVFRFSKNFGAHAAIHCGLSHALGECAVVMASDLQDPPETIPQLLAKWQLGGQVIWAVRNQREGEGFLTLFFSRMYYRLMRRFGGLENTPASGADFWLMDRVVVDAYLQFHESHVSTLSLILWMGFRQESILYDKKARGYGSSGWTLRKKLKLLVDSVTSFTHFPIRLMSYLGILFSFSGFIFAIFIIINVFQGKPAAGWSSLMVAIMVIGGIQMGMLGVLGEYLWRTHDESRRRPRYLIQEKSDSTEQPQNLEKKKNNG